MKLEWILLCEGIGVDAKGAMTLIGLNQNILGTESFPASTKRALVGHVTFPQGKPPGIGTQIRFNIRFEDPKKNVLAATSGAVVIGPGPLDEAPTSFDIPAELGLTVSMYGAHAFVLEVIRPDGGLLKGQTKLYVVPPDSVAPLPAPGGQLQKRQG